MTAEYSTKADEENKRLREKNQKVQIVLRAKKCVREKSIVKRDNKGLRGERMKGTKAKKRRKKVKVENKRCRSCSGAK